VEDFAGGTVVHANAGAASIAVALVLRKRFGYGRREFDRRPHNVPYVVPGAGLLWFGWFGFNAGSALGAGNLAGIAFLNTNTATAAAMLAWITVERLRNGKPTLIGAASGAVAGLVAITPACGFGSPMGSIAIGLAAGTVCALATGIKKRVGGISFSLASIINAIRPMRLTDQEQRLGMDLALHGEQAYRVRPNSS
jgi:Amt family ammonium transporter